MARKVADVMWEMLANAGVQRCYGIVGDALNPVIDALRRNGNVDFAIAVEVCRGRDGFGGTHSLSHNWRLERAVTVARQEIQGGR